MTTSTAHAHLASTAHIVAPAPAATVAVYWDFDNMLISRYDQMHGNGAYRSQITGRRNLSAELRSNLRAARLDLAATVPFIAGCGHRLITRAYGDWSSPALADYGPDLITHATDLVQLFPVAHGKNGADIRLTIDVVEDVRTEPLITDVVIFAGDSDYVALARHCQRHGRRVTGVGVRGHTAATWSRACDTFVFYDDLVDTAAAVAAVPAQVASGRPTTLRSAAEDTAGPTADPVGGPASCTANEAPDAAVGGSTDTTADTATDTTLDPGEEITAIVTRARAVLVAALRELQAARPGEWVSPQLIKPAMRRLDPTFDHLATGQPRFGGFLEAHADLLDFGPAGPAGRVVALHEGADPGQLTEAGPCLGPYAHAAPPADLPADPAGPAELPVMRTDERDVGGEAPLDQQAGSHAA